MPTPVIMITVPLGADQRTALDSAHAALRAASPGIRISRSDVVRAALMAFSKQLAPETLQHVARSEPKRAARTRKTAAGG